MAEHNDPDPNEAPSHVAVVGSLDEGIKLYGPFAGREVAGGWLGASGRRNHHHCEVLPLVRWPALGGPWEPEEGDEPHVLLVGSFADGFSAHGPFLSFEHAEQSSGCFVGHAVPMPLNPPD